MISIGIKLLRGIAGGAMAISGLIRVTEDGDYRVTEDGLYRELDS